MVFIQVTNEINESSEDFKNISADGTRIAFDSRANINGGNPGNIDQIYLADTNLGINVQITNGSANSSRPSINADGTRIAFHSDADITGGNPQLERQVYIATCLDPMTARNISDFERVGAYSYGGGFGRCRSIGNTKKKGSSRYMMQDAG